MNTIPYEFMNNSKSNSNRLKTKQNTTENRYGSGSASSTNCTGKCVYFTCIFNWLDLHTTDETHTN